MNEDELRRQRIHDDYAKSRAKKAPPKPLKPKDSKCPSPSKEITSK